VANPKLSTLVDGFTAATLNGSVWTGTGGTFALDTTRDLVTVNVGTTPGVFNNFNSVATFDATNTSVFAQVWPAMTGNTANTALKLDAGSNNAISALVTGTGSFTFRLTNAGAFVDTALPTYNPSTHRWWMLSEAAGVYTFSTSPDGQTWTALASVAHAWDATASKLFFQTGSGSNTTAGLQAAIAHVSTLAGGSTRPKLGALVDGFTGSSINSALWNASSVGQSTLDTVNDQVLLNVATTTFSFPSFGSASWDITGSALYAQITVAPNFAGVLTILKVDAGSNFSISAKVTSPSGFEVDVQAFGSTSVLNLPTYDPHQHRWWRFSEANGLIVFATSPDGLNWTSLQSVAYTWPFTSVQVFLQTGTGGTAPPAGLTAGIAHVNTQAGGPLNPNWPVVEDAWGPYWGANAGTVAPDRYVDLSNLTQGSVNFNRGKQYELDQVRSGEGQVGLLNTDAAFEPTNPSGPWFGHVKPYEPFKRRAQWPPTRNLLTQVQATGGDLGGYPTGSIPTEAGVSSDTGGGTIKAVSGAWQGGRVLDFIVAAGAPSNSVVFRTAQPAADPGTIYTHTVRVRNVAASGTLQVKPYVAWYTAGVATPTFVDGGTVGLVGSASAAWTTLTITATAPATVAGIEIGMRTAVESPDADIQVDGWQLEQGPSSTAWTCPGVWYPVFSGFMERFPSKWDMEGTFGTVQPTVVDAFALLSQVTLSDPLTEEVTSSGPRFLYKLDDPSGSMSAADATGNFGAAPIAVSKYGAGSLSFGSPVTAADTVNGIFTGAPGPVVTINNASPGQAVTAAASFLRLAAAGITGPADPGFFTRALAFRYVGPTPTAAACLWSCMDNQRANGNPSGSRIFLYILNDNKIHFFMTGPDGSTLVNTTIGTANVVDSNWHLVTFGYRNDTGQVIVSLDGATTLSSVTPLSGKPTGIVGDNLGGFVDVTVGNGTTWNFKGDIAFAGEWPTLLNATQLSNLFEAWKSACVGDTTDQRYARILRYAGYTGSSVIQTGLTTSMGPANIAGQDVVTALQNVVTTENGQHYIDRSGAPTFRARSARYNATIPAYVFGERADLGEWPYEDVETDYDTTHLANDVSVTQEPTGQVFHAKDAGSRADYFPRPMDRTINSTSGPECQDAADYLLSRYKQPLTRISTIKLHPAAIPAMWPVCLSLELGTRVRVMRRAPGVPARQLEAFVEQLQWEFSDSGDAWLTLQCSPADTTPYGVFVPWYAAVTFTVASGVNSLDVLNRRDNANPLAAQLAPGQQLVLGVGTANQETVTVQSVATTSPGWTSATITFTTNTTKPHSANETVSEPLPAGVTDPTTWDSAGTFDAVAFAY
jgi:hypothetical protein